MGVHGTLGFQEYGGGEADAEFAPRGMPSEMEKSRNRTSNNEVVRRVGIDKDGC